MATFVEDALRTATLPESGSGRLVLIRHLNFGRIDPRANPTTLALQLERAIRRGRASIVPASDPAAASATGVWFRHPEEAVAMLARRLAGGQGTAEWFWPLAVPGWRADRSLADAWRLLIELAQAQSAPVVAVGPIVRELLVAGEIFEVLSRISEGEAQGWLTEAGFSLERQEPGINSFSVGKSPLGLDDPRLVKIIRSGQARDRAFQERLVWLVTMAVLDRHPAWAADAHLPIRVRQWIEEMRVRNGLSSDGEVVHDGVSRREAPSAGWVERASTLQPKFRGSAPDLERKQPQSSLGRDAQGEPAAEASSGDSFTSAGGLLFLIPILRELGFPAFIAARPELAHGGFGAAVLCEFARRVRVPVNDSIWEVLASITSAMSGDSSIAEELPSSLQTWLEPRLPSFVPDETKVGPRRISWVTGARRWSRRCVRMGLHNLIRRPARFEFSRTRIDLTFTLDQIDLRVRGAGLDLDPGWVPWLGRIIHFHYHGSHDA